MMDGWMDGMHVSCMHACDHLGCIGLLLVGMHACTHAHVRSHMRCMADNLGCIGLLHVDKTKSRTNSDDENQGTDTGERCVLSRV